MYVFSTDVRIKTDSQFTNDAVPSDESKNRIRTLIGPDS